LSALTVQTKISI